MIQNPLYGQQCNPERMEWHARRTTRITAPYGDPRFPYVLTTYRLTEHHTAGGMSRWLSWLSELQPEMFCEVSPELAAEARTEERRLGHHSHRAGGDRGAGARDRAAAAASFGAASIHQIGLPYHWSRKVWCEAMPPMT